MNEKQLLCPHRNFAAKVEVNRLEDTGQFLADLRITCADCNLPFSFKGLPVGLDLNGASVDVDGGEARLALQPGLSGMFVPQET